MADEGDILTDLNPDPAAGANGLDNQPAVGVISQYVKDLSVENPNAPACFQWNEQPQLDVQFNIGAEAAGDDVHEVVLKVTATAKTSKGNLYLVDLEYCGLIGIRNLPDEHAHAFMFAEAPRLLFPFARRVIADAVRDAGFPPLVLDPIDFGGIYQQQIAQRAAQQGEGVPAPTGEA
ncbi:protein-export chaperone SecB [Qipengyuania sp. 6B39]|uniref:protein-export chaperone SecB n=1 Tax=Qipengyuania proteolytica TaxID=2867239 RepID=UPI001C8B0A10|nr:protein-export chaperone SecB [Qipengyuania proteolytica]MBX7494959.1 protein-export chaperone SecB [Qipengyuania proteolytica]